MISTKWYAIIIVCGMGICLNTYGQNNPQINRAIQRYNSGAIDGDAFSSAILETVYQSEDPKSIAKTLKSSGVAVNDHKQWTDTIIEFAEYLGLLGEYQDAVDMYEYLMRHPSLRVISINEIWERIAVLQFANNDVQGALASAHKALTTATNQDEVVKALLLDARFRGLSSNPQAGLAAIDALIVHNPSSIHMRLLLYAKFEIQQTIGDEVGAEATRALLLKHYPNSLEHGIVNTHERNTAIIASPLPVAIDYIYSLYQEHSSDHTHTHRPIAATANRSTPTSTQTPTSASDSVGTADNSIISASQSTTSTGVNATTAANQQVVIQLGAFTNQTNAKLVQQKSASIGVPAQIILVDNIYKVQTSIPQTNVSTVRSQLQKVDIDAYIVR